MKASLALFSLLTVFTSYSLKSPAVPPTVVQIQANTNLAIADGARQQIGSTLFYDPAYVQLTYPGGDVPQERGVCSDDGLAHIGVVSDGFARDGTPLVIHNIGAGAQEEDVLFSWRMVGHYRYFAK